MSKNEIKAIASPMTGCPAWTIAVFKAEDVPEGTEVFPVAPVQAQEPAAHLKFWAAQSWSGNGNHDIDCGEGLEVCEAGEIGADKLPAFPVYRAPVLPVAVPEAAQQNGGLVRAVLIDLLSPEVERAANSGAVSFECQSNITTIFARGRQALAQSAFDATPAAQDDAKDEVYEFAAKVIELFDDAAMRAGYMLDAGECASIIRALKSTEIAAIAAKAAS